jgi:hypothetical protein
MMMCDQDTFAGNVKAMIAGITGAPAETITSEDAIEISTDRQPLANSIVEVAAKNVTTKAGNPFTAVDFIREIPPAEAIQSIPADVVAVAFPNNLLATLASQQTPA